VDVNQPPHVVPARLEEMSRKSPIKHSHQDGFQAVLHDEEAGSSAARTSGPGLQSNGQWPRTEPFRLSCDDDCQVPPLCEASARAIRYPSAVLSA